MGYWIRARKWDVLITLPPIIYIERINKIIIYSKIKLTNPSRTSGIHFRNTVAN